MYEKENILSIFQETKVAILRGDPSRIKNLSNRTTNSASLTHDPDNIAAAVIIYSISKIIERTDYQKIPEWDKFYKSYLNSIDKIIEAIKKENYEAYRKEIRIMRSGISKFSGELEKSIQEVFRKASINKASKIYEHGISMEKTANLLGITLFELASYAGERGISDAPGKQNVDVRTRIKFAEEMFE